MSGNELCAVIESMERDRGIERSALIQMVEEALISAARKSAAGPARDMRIKIDEKTLAIQAFALMEVVDRVTARNAQIGLNEARRIKDDVQIGDLIEIEMSTRDFGRIAAQTARHAIVQKIRQAEKEIVLKEYKDRLGDVVSGTIVRLERGDVIVDLGKVEAIMPAREKVPMEEYQVGDRTRAYVLSVQEHVSGYQVTLSRSHPDFVRRLFELEISEIADGTVKIEGIAREAGFRTKIAVSSRDEKVDPVGACVGMRGMRVKNIVRELLGEKIDIVRWSPDIKTYITNALNPAKLNKIIVDERDHRVTVVADADQLSLAIGKRGQNARLTSKLLGWKVDIQKDKEDVSFEEKIIIAIDNLLVIEGLERNVAEKLVRAGFLSVDGIIAADLADLADAAGLNHETAAAIKQAATRQTTSAEDGE
ncbi:MAG: transcription termination factor NusA [Kiritimatiellia bacterium]|nr:transcription termination factor NusA [Lentisphaerota bacterium]